MQSYAVVGCLEERREEEVALDQRVAAEPILPRRSHAQSHHIRVLSRTFGGDTRTHAERVTETRWRVTVIARIAQSKQHRLLCCRRLEICRDGAARTFMLTSARGPWNMMFSEIVFWHETAEKIAQLCLVYRPCPPPCVGIHLRGGRSR